MTFFERCIDIDNIRIAVVMKPPHRLKSPESRCAPIKSDGFACRSDSLTWYRHRLRHRHRHSQSLTATQTCTLTPNSPQQYLPQPTTTVSLYNPCLSRPRIPNHRHHTVSYISFCADKRETDRRIAVCVTTLKINGSL